MTENQQVLKYLLTPFDIQSGTTYRATNVSLGDGANA